MTETRVCICGVILTVLSGCGSREALAPSTPESNPPSAREPSATAAPSSDAPVLDATRGEQAVSAYTARREQYCRSRGRSSDAEFVRIYDGDAGSSLDELGVSICEFPVDAVALASGSFFSNDDVVLSVPSGGDRAGGDRTLALMRGDGVGHYTFSRHVARGNDSFRGAARTLHEGSRDTIRICNDSGSQGLTQSDCGVLTESGLVDVVHTEEED